MFFMVLSLPSPSPFTSVLRRTPLPALPPALARELRAYAAARAARRIAAAAVATVLSAAARQSARSLPDPLMPALHARETPMRDHAPSLSVSGSQGGQDITAP